MRLLITALCAALGCAACGFKGPLYLPGRNAAVVTHPAPGAKRAPNGPQAAGKSRHGRDRTGTQGSAGQG